MRASMLLLITAPFALIALAGVAGFAAATAAPQVPPAASPAAAPDEGSAQDPVPADPGAPAGEDGETQEDARSPGRNRERYLAAEAAVSRHLKDYSRSIVRVRAYYMIELRRATDGALVDTRRIESGIGAGIVVRPEPWIMVSGALGKLTPGVPGMRPPRSPSVTIGPMRFELIAPDETAIQVEVCRADRARNVNFLRPVPGAAVPDALRQPLTGIQAVRAEGGSFLGLPVFNDPYRDASMTAVVVGLPPGRELFPRPALTVAGLNLIGMPLYDVDGTFVGIVNVPHADEGIPRWARDSTARDERPAERDPTEFVGGQQHPVVISALEMAPLLEEIAAQPGVTLPFEPLGFTLRDQDGRAVVCELAADGPAATAGLALGDAITAVGDSAVTGSESFSAALEQALGADAAVLRLRVERNSGTVDVELPVP